jgi:hypothetical protein
VGKNRLPQHEQKEEFSHSPLQRVHWTKILSRSRHFRSAFKHSAQRSALKSSSYSRKSSTLGLVGTVFSSVSKKKSVRALIFSGAQMAADTMASAKKAKRE